MARKKGVIGESIKRTPEERKGVEDQLNRERTPEELKRAILKLGGGAQASYGANGDVGFDKRISAKLVSTGDEVYYKEADEEGEYAESHFSELKRGFIDIIKQNPQNGKIKEDEVSACMDRLPLGEEWKPKDLVVTNWHMNCIADGCKKGRATHIHYKNGFTKEEGTEIENALNYNKNNMPNSNTNSAEPSDRTGLYIGLGIGAVILILVIFILARIRKKKKF